MEPLLYSPSLMCADQLNLGYQIDILNRYNFDFLHLDIMDLNFVPNIALGFDVVNSLKKYSIPKDIHLMVNNVQLALSYLSVTPNDYVSFHIEINNQIIETLQTITNLGAKPGLVINPDTPVERIYPFLPYVKLVHLMTVKPGFSGQLFMKSSYERLRKLKSTIISNNYNILVGVDGAISLDQISQLYERGANIFVLGKTCLFKNNFEDQIDQLINYKIKESKYALHCL